MSRTPAANLARVKVRFPTWSIGRAPGRLIGYVAERHNGRDLDSVYAPTLTELEATLEKKAGVTDDAPA